MQALFDRPANALGTIISQDGPVSIMGLMLLSPAGSTIEEFIPPSPGPVRWRPPFPIHACELLPTLAELFSSCNA